MEPVAGCPTKSVVIALSQRWHALSECPHSIIKRHAQLLQTAQVVPLAKPIRILTILSSFPGMSTTRATGRWFCASNTGRV